MRVLVLATDYPSMEKPATLRYIHTRNLYYIKNGIEVKVLNFSCTQGYVVDGVQVVTLEEYRSSDEKFDVLISHAPNLKNHYCFLKKYQDGFFRMVFFFHGHEVLLRSRVYSKPYFYVKENLLRKIIDDCYDVFKLFIWRHYFPQIASKSMFVFVSKWMKDEFMKWTKLSDQQLKNNTRITYNSVGHDFEINTYNRECEKEYDFITIRSVLDGSKYAVDLVLKIATRNPDKRFLLVGKGRIFEFFNKPANVIWLDKYVAHEEILDLLNRSKCALMPTRTDAQGVMACEIATYGMPLITSDIPVCREVFDEFENVGYISNDYESNTIMSVYNRIEVANSISRKYTEKLTIRNEVKIINSIVKY